MPRRSIATVVLLVVTATAGLSSRQNPRTLGTPGAEMFTMRVVASGLANPWEVTWGPDGFLWITERTGFRVTRVNPADGTRRVALTMPDFASALATVAETDLIAAMPRRFVAMHAARFAVVSREVPLSLRAFTIKAAVPKVALMDAGLAWLFNAMGEAVQGRGGKTKRRAEARAAS